MLRKIKLTMDEKIEIEAIDLTDRVARHQRLIELAKKRGFDIRYKNFEYVRTTNEILIIQT